MPAFQVRGMSHEESAMGMASYLPGFHAGTTEIRYPADHPRAAGERIMWSRVDHAITPATARTCTYHLAIAGDERTDRVAMKTALDPVIDEDVFASVEKMIDLYDGNPPPELMVRSDRTTIEGRRMIQAMMDAEAQEMMQVAAE